MKATILSLVSLLLVASPVGGQSVPPVQADHDLALDAVKRGEFLPLDQILDIVGQFHPGTLIEVELESDDDIWVYEVEIKTPEGRLVEIDLNAATGDIIEVEQEGDD